MFCFQSGISAYVSVITVIVVVIGACLIVLAAAIYLMWQRKGELEDLCLKCKSVCSIVCANLSEPVAYIPSDL